MADFYTKYLKYKTKYLLLKGGNPNRKIIVATHNNRLQCFFLKLNKEKNLKFKNCAIIKCYKNGNKIFFEMIYSGELDGEYNNLEEYWDIESFNKMNFMMDHKPTKVFEIYLVRHGKGIHNGANITDDMLKEDKYLDAPLDTIGFSQAKRAGSFLKEHLKGNLKKNISSLHFGASHLLRTRQTIVSIQLSLGIKKEIIIVPCVHEIDNCDDGILQESKKLGNENTPLCSKSGNMNIDCMFVEKLCSDPENQYCSIEKNKFQVNWGKYLRFYANNRSCITTNMMEQIIEVFS